MRRTRLRAAIGALLLTLVLPASVTGCACTTMGYINVDPIAVAFAEPLANGTTMAACFDAGCEPAEIAVGNGERAEVPQEWPYRSDDQIDPAQELRIVLTTVDGTVVHDEVHDIRIASDNPLSPCPGPFHYEDVVVG